MVWEILQTDKDGVISPILASGLRSAGAASDRARAVDGGF